MSTSGQFLTVPPLSHRSSHHRRRDHSSARAAPQSAAARPRPHYSATGAGTVASSSKLRLEDTPLGPTSPPPPIPGADTTTTTTDTDASDSLPSSPPFSPSSSAQASPTSATRQQPRLEPFTNRANAPRTTTTTTTSSNTTLTSTSTSTSTSNSNGARSPPPSLPSPSSQQLSPRNIFRAMPFLLRLRSPPSDLISLTCTSGAPRTHSSLNKSGVNIITKAPHPLTYSKALVCADAVNAEVLLRLARNELLKRAQDTNRHATALVDEEWRYSIQQTKSGDYNVQVFYSACPAMCEGPNPNVPVDPRKPVALSHVTNIPGLMRVVHSE